MDHRLSRLRPSSVRNARTATGAETEQLPHRCISGFAWRGTSVPGDASISRTRAWIKVAGKPAHPYWRSDAAACNWCERRVDAHLGAGSQAIPG